VTPASDYAERVYAGVLGKTIGVYLGRPVEGWSYERITERFGEIDRYVSGELGLPLVVADDDLTGTFTFVRAVSDSARGLETRAEDVAAAWLNYVLEGRTVFWWGGVGVSTEHTAYERLRTGISPPASGSKAVNGSVLAEQIGAQIFIDGWALVSPGRPVQAAELARRAATVSHDGEAVFGAQVIAAMEAEAFVTSDIDRLLDCGLRSIPAGSLIARMIEDIRGWHADEDDWRAARERLAAEYADRRFPGMCHVVPNHGRVILALLYGEGDFARSMTIVNTSGFDTDCNAGNLGCLLGIRAGLACFDQGVDWRGPVADRLILPTADGGSVVTDCLRTAVELTTIGHALAGTEHTPPKNGARFSFAFPGAVQGFAVAGGTARIANTSGRDGGRALEITLVDSRAVQVVTPTFAPPSPAGPGAYEVRSSPTLHSGQVVRARLEAPPDNPGAVSVRPLVQVGAEPQVLRGPEHVLSPGGSTRLAWQVPATDGEPVRAVGVALAGGPGSVFVDRVDWRGAPDVSLLPASPTGTALDAWIDAVEECALDPDGSVRITVGRQRGLLLQGTREWTDYVVDAVLDSTEAQAVGLVARAQGLRRYYALVLNGDSSRLVKVAGEKRTLWEGRREPRAEAVHVAIEVCGATLRVFFDDTCVARCLDIDEPLLGGGVGLLCDRGSLRALRLAVRPL